MRRLSGIFLGLATAVGINLRLSPQVIVLWKTYCWQVVSHGSPAPRTSGQGVGGAAGPEYVQRERTGGKDCDVQLPRAVRAGAAGGDCEEDRADVGSEPRHLLQSVIAQGAVIAVGGIVAGAAGGYVLARLAGSYFETVRTPGPLVVIGASTVLLAAALIASVLPAVRAARVDVLEALRSE